MSTPPAAFTADQLEDQVRNLLSDNVNYAGVAPDSIDPQTWSLGLLPNTVFTVAGIHQLWVPSLVAHFTLRNYNERCYGGA